MAIYPLLLLPPPLTVSTLTVKVINYHTGKQQGESNLFSLYSYMHTCFLSLSLVEAPSRFGLATIDDDYLVGDDDDRDDDDDPLLKFLCCAILYASSTHIC
jgi:hypothetical protein